MFASAVALLVLALAVAGPCLANPEGDSQGEMTNPASPAARQISGLFWLITAIALAVGIFVEALIVYTVLKFRADKKTGGQEGAGDAEGGAGAKGEASAGSSGRAAHEEDAHLSASSASAVHPAHHGNTKLEIGYTAVTAAVFAMLVVLSWGTLFSIETPQDPVQMNIDVTGSQWSWKFFYPSQGVTESATLSEMHVPVNTTVRLNVTSTDVAHAVWIPDLGVKIDAYPGRINHFWFKAEREGRFFLQCAEFCGGSHSEMHAVVISQSQADFDAWVAAKVAAANPPPPPLGDGAVVNVTLTEYAITLDAPLPLNIDEGAHITFNVVNGGTMPHAFAVGAPYNLATANITNGANATLQVLFNQTVLNGTYYCPLSNHRDLGMSGLFNVTASARVIDVYLHDSGVAGDTFHIEPASVDAVPGELVKFRVHNNGTMAHNLAVGDAALTVVSPNVDPGSVTFTPAYTVKQSVEYWCNVPGHKSLGMVGTLNAGGAVAKEASNVPGFDFTTVMPAVSLAAVAVLWTRERRKVR